MTMYEKRPDRIEARQFSGLATIGECEQLAEWCGGNFNYDRMKGQQKKTYYWSIWANNRVSNFSVTIGDYIVKRSDGSFCAMKAPQFEREYQEAAA